MQYANKQWAEWDAQFYGDDQFVNGNSRLQLGLCQQRSRLAITAFRQNPTDEGGEVAKFFLQHLTDCFERYANGLEQGRYNERVPSAFPALRSEA